MPEGNENLKQSKYILISIATLLPEASFFLTSIDQHIKYSCIHRTLTDTKDCHLPVLEWKI